MLTGKALFNTVVSELNDMGLPGMSSTLDEMFRSPDFIHLDPLMAIARLVEPEYQKKINTRIQSRLRAAHLRGCPQELSSCVDSADREYLPRGITGTLSSLDFVASGMNLCILGPSDSGKSYLAKALGIVACNDYKVEYHHCEVLLEQLVALKTTDYMKYQKRLKRICGASLLILDDFLLHTLSDEREVKILFEILEQRCEINLSTIICSQRDPSSWTAMIMNDAVSANAILKRATRHYTVMIKPKAIQTDH
jgi:DNA replication protein DnaC